MKELSLAVMCVQNGATPLIMRWAMTGAGSAEQFDSSEAVLVQEALKLAMSVLLLLVEHQWAWESTAGVLRSEVIGKPEETLRLAVPAVLYFILNVCLQLAAAALPAAMFQVSYQAKTLVVALFSVILLNKQLSRVQWLSIVSMAAGLAVVQTGKNSERPRVGSVDDIPKGLLIVLIGCVCSGLAGVYFEKILKGSAGSKVTSVWVRNVQLASWSCIIGATVQIGKVIVPGMHTTHPFLHGFRFHVWIMVFNNAAGGMVVAVVIKHADNILKGFATALATVWAALASVPLFGFNLSAEFCVGMMIILGSSLGYAGTITLPGKWWSDEPACCRRLRGEEAAPAVGEHIFLQRSKLDDFVLPSWPTSVANATAGLCLTAVGCGSATTGGWTAPAAQFVLAGTLLLTASGLQISIALDWASHGWPARLLLLLHGVAGVASLSVAAAVYFLTGDKHGMYRSRLGSRIWGRSANAYDRARHVPRWTVGWVWANFHLWLSRDFEFRDHVPPQQYMQLLHRGRGGYGTVAGVPGCHSAWRWPLWLDCDCAASNPRASF